MNDKSAAALKYFLMMCESMALDPDADCNPELKYIKAALTPDAKDEGGAVPMVLRPATGKTIPDCRGIAHLCAFQSSIHVATPSQPQAVAEPIEAEIKCKWCNTEMFISKDLPSVLHPEHLLWSANCANDDCAFSQKETRGYDRKYDLIKDLTRATPPAKDTTSEIIRRAEELIKHEPPRRWSFNAHKAWDNLKAALSRGKD